MGFAERIRQDYAWSIARGRAVVLAQQRELWPLAVRDGIVSGSPPPILRAAPSIQEVAGLQRYLSGIVDGLVGEITGRFTKDVAKRIGQLAEKAISEGWDRAKFFAEVAAFGRIAGVEMGGSWMETWYRTYVVSAGYNAGLLVGYQAEPTRRLFPALAYHDRKDDRVRPAHRLLGTPPLVAPVLWYGWDIIRPPNGFNCRCWLRALTWFAFRALGVDLAELEMAANARLSRYSPEPGFGR